MRWKVSAHSSHNRLRGSVDHLGPGLDMRSGGDRMIDHTISLRSLGAFLLSRAEFGVTHVEDPTRGTLVHVGRVTVGATTVARKALWEGLSQPCQGSDTPSSSDTPSVLGERQRQQSLGDG